MGNVYIAISPSNKKYVGVTSQNTNERWKEHTQRAREGRPGAIYNAIRKYGIDSFMIFTLFESDDWDLLLKKESEFIIENNSKYPNGYNLTDGGEGNYGMVVSEESRKRMSEGQKKRFQNPEQRNWLIKNGNKAREIRAKKWEYIREIKKKQKEIYHKSEEYKKMHSDRTKEGMAKVKDIVIQCAKKRAANPEWRKKISEIKKGCKYSKPRTEESKKKMSESMKAVWEKRKNQN